MLYYYPQHCSKQICAHSSVCIMVPQEDSRRELTETRGMHAQQKGVHATARTWPSCCVSWWGSWLPLLGTPSPGNQEEGLVAVRVGSSCLSPLGPNLALFQPNVTATILRKI